MNDTHPEVERVHIELLRKAGPQRRLAMAMELTNDVLRRARAGIARARPHLSDRERQLLFVEVAYGREITERVRAFLHQRESTV